MNRTNAPTEDLLRSDYEQKLADRPGFYSVLRTADGVVVRGTSEFQASWAEADVPERPITVLVVDLSMAELSTHLSAALVTAEAALAGDAAIARTYASPDRNLVKIYLTGVDEPAIDTLNATLDDPYVVCVDLRRLPRRYRSSTDPG